MRFYVFGPHPADPSLRGPLVPVTIEDLIKYRLREGQSVNEKTMRLLLEEAEPAPKRKHSHPSWHTPVKSLPRRGGVEGAA